MHNANGIFKSEKVDKSDELVDAVNNFTIKDTKYYESNTATGSDTQGDLTLNPEIVTHTSNNNVEQKVLSNRTILVLTLTMNPVIDLEIALVVLVPQTLLTPATKEVVADVVSGGAWKNRTPRQVSRNGVDGSTPGYIRDDVSIIEHTYPFLIEVTGTFPPCGLNMNQQVANKRQSTFPGLVGKTQTLDAIVDRKLPTDLDSASIFSKVIGHKLSHSSRGDLYMLRRMNLAINIVQTETS